MLDPIDGTKGFISNGQFAIGLAYIHHGRPVLGVIGAPNFPYDELYHTQEEWNKCHDDAGCVVVGIDDEERAAVMYDLHSNRSKRLQCSSLHPLFGAICSRQKVNHTATYGEIMNKLHLPDTVLEIDSMCKYIAVIVGVASIYVRENAHGAYRVVVIGERHD